MAIRTRMDLQGLTQAELAKRAGLDDSVLSRYLRGEVKRVRLDFLDKISDGLGIQRDDLRYQYELAVKIRQEEAERFLASQVDTLDEVMSLLSSARPNATEAERSMVESVIGAFLGPTHRPTGQ